MKPRQILIAVALSLALPMKAFASSPVERKQAPLDQAHLDALSILQRDNSCSRFFGGLNAAAEVLGQLIAKFQRGLIQDSKIGIRMAGAFIYFDKPEKGLSYRLFAEAKINTIGPFYKSKAFPADPFVPNVGSFKPNTRAARVLIILHELAHLLMRPDGKWLIPDDGNSPEQSARNTALIEAQCRNQILSLSGDDID
jgi:hypothetical protein